MTLEVARIDERLLHGQVVVGWGERLGVDHYVVVDDELAGSTWEQEMYATGVPAAAEVEFLDVEAALERFGELDGRAGTGMLLTRGTGAMRRLASAGHLEGRPVDVGCLGASSGRSRALDYVHLSDEEAEDLVSIAEHGASVAGRDLPDARRVPLSELLDARERS